MGQRNMTVSTQRRPDPPTEAGVGTASGGFKHVCRIEAALAGIVIASVVLVGLRFWVNGYLPHPFQSDPARSLMDFYNTAYWANHDGAYSVWHTVYPPISFVFLRLWTSPPCYHAGAMAARDCAPLAVLPIIGFYLLNVALVYLSYQRQLSRCSAVSRTIAVCAGISMLYGLELANLIIPCFTFFILRHGGFIRSRRLTILAEAIAINFKPYLIVTVLPNVILRRRNALLSLGAALFGVYLATYLLNGSGSPSDIIRDIWVYAHHEDHLYARVNNLAAFVARSGNLWNSLFPIPLRLVQLAVVLVCAMALYSPAGVEPRRLTALVLTVVSAEAAIRTQGHSADYTQIFLLFLIFLERWEDTPRVILLSCAYLLSVSADTVILPVSSGVYQSYFGHRAVFIEQGLTLGQFLRPTLLLVMQGALLVLVLRDLKVAQSGLRRLRRLAVR